MKLRVRSSSGLTQLGGDTPPQVQHNDDGSGRRLQRVAGTQPLRSSNRDTSELQGYRRQDTNKLQPANVPTRGKLPNSRGLQKLQPKLKGNFKKAKYLLPFASK